MRRTKEQQRIAGLTTVALGSLNNAIEQLAHAARATLAIGAAPSNVGVEILRALTDAKRAKARLEIFERAIPGNRRKRT